MSYQIECPSYIAETVELHLRIPQHVFHALRGAAIFGEAYSGERMSTHIAARLFLEEGLERAAEISGTTVEEFEKIGKKK
jgi:hypothetical protein